MFSTIVKESPRWEDVPDRLMSTFATHSVEMAGGFGQPMLIIPGNDVKTFAFCPVDFNDYDISAAKRLQLMGVFHALDGISFRLASAISGQKKIKEYFEPILKQNSLDADIDISSIKSYQILLKAMSFFDWVVEHEEEIQKLLNNDRAFAKHVRTLKEYLDDLDVSTCVDYITKAFTPENYAVKLYDSISKLPKTDDETEVWFEGSYLLIDLDVGDDEQMDAVDVLKLAKKYL